MNTSKTSNLIAQTAGLLAVSAASLACFASPVVAADLESLILSADGEVARLKVSPSPQPALVLELGDESEIVPGAGNSAPLGMLKSPTGELHVFWLTEEESGSRLSMSSRSGEEWDGPHSILAAGAPVSFSDAPSLLVEEERLSLEVEAGLRLTSERQIVHVTWNEDGVGLRYSSFVIRDGRYVGWNEVVTISSAFRQAHPGIEPLEIAEEIAGTMRVTRSPRGGVLLTLTDDGRNRIGTLHLGPVSMASELLADSIHDDLLAAADVFDPDDLSSLADEIRGTIIIAGSILEFDEDMTAFFSDRIESWIHLKGSEFGWDLLALADATRSESLDLSQSVYRTNLQTASGADIPVFDLIDFLDSNGHRDDFSRLMRLSLVSDLAAPEDIGDDVEVHVSTDGSALALSWVDAETGAVHWTEGRHGAWSDSKSLATGESMDEAAIRELISESIR